MTDLKFCKDCKFCEPDKSWLAKPPWWLLFIPVIGWIIFIVEMTVDKEYYEHNQWRFAKCSKTYRKYEGTVDILSGVKSEDTEWSNFCSTARKYKCGPDAKWFEPK